ncbi:cytochrome c oxidase assembly protein [Arthrobacter cheniae]|uniref:Cytochrome c oxidase assembly protein n=1 Tax=Arthrobacter cheniae TaxID=1258888 RepID=A0A3A5MJP1_9MICC|nr:cytochrome c oxidase assembly protein [Arthrobacter cheniae]RJT83444.1 cytochrome c oxidase assembly protein [Arthrobacter cheniae]
MPDVLHRVALDNPLLQHPFVLHHGEAGTASGTGDLSAFALETAVVLVWLGLAAGYLVAGRAAVLRGRTQWPVRRTVSWLTGIGLGLAVTAGPISSTAAGSLTVHTAVHLVLGLLVPLLLVLGRPATLVLRAVPACAGRRLTGMAGSAPLRMIGHPMVALLLTVVPMAFLYWDGTALPLLHHPLLGPLIHVHFVASGALFTYAVVGLDPNPHRASEGVRAAAILASIAAHGVVAKHLYSAAGRGGLPPDAEQAAQLMYYGGDAVHVLLLVVFCAHIYRRTGRHLPRLPIRHSSEGSPGRVV